MLTKRDFVIRFSSPKFEYCITLELKAREYTGALGITFDDCGEKTTISF